MKKIINVDDSTVEMRLDRWFKRHIFHVPQSLLEKRIRKGNIKVNGKKVLSSYKLRKNDKVLIKNFYFIENKNIKSKNQYEPNKKDLDLSSKIFITNNENFVVINKPSGIAVQSGTKSKKNIIDILRNTNEFKEDSPFTVHRIDKETTGILIVAKNRKYAQLFTSLFRIRKIHKVYLGIVLGKLENNKGTLINNLVSYEGKKKINNKAVTHYSVIDSNNNYSLLKLTPETGRKHQIRKQLLMIGHPILGDEKYRFSQKVTNRKNFLMLHAYKINFTINNIKYKYVADLPIEFINTLTEKSLKNFLR
tara:strand:- start:386 stop:1303 length:918 start_codon:yes stop_codon:yes gene_type:complete